MSTEAVVVPMEIKPRMTWLSWVGATTACLRALGVECDEADVAGASGYAFCLSINKGLCASGPTCVDWTALVNGPLCLGRTAQTFTSWDCHVEETACDRTREHCRRALEIVRTEVAAGRPAVVWGLGVPEFGVVRGVEGDNYLCVAGGPTPERVTFDKINAPGGPYVLAFPSVKVNWPGTDAYLLQRALHLLTTPSRASNQTRGIRAWDYWMRELDAGEAVTWCQSYNAQCWAEARKWAHEFAGRLADRNEAVAPSLREAQEAFSTVAEHLGVVAERCPFDMKFVGDPITDRALIDELVENLRAGKEAEITAIAALGTALDDWPEAEAQPSSEHSCVP